VEDSNHCAGKFQSARRKSLAATGIVLAVLAVLIGQTAPLWAQSATDKDSASPSRTAAGEKPSFEVASVKLNRSGDIRFGIGGPGSSLGRFIAKNVPAKVLIYWAYGLKDFQLSGGPSWINSERYDIDAKVEDSLVAKLKKLSHDKQDKQTRLMLQVLLEDRFKLKLRHGTQERPIYALFVAKGGPKLATTTLGSPGLTVTNPSGSPSGHQMAVASGEITAIGTPIRDLVDELSMMPEINRIVLDQTGLQGYYDFTLRWSPEGSTSPGGDAGQRPGNASVPDSSVTSIFTAIQDQLGLRLESKRGLVESDVIEHVEEPSPN
jgi:uncharacterized protein (TIGR03435 family)